MSIPLLAATSEAERERQGNEYSRGEHAWTETDRGQLQFIQQRNITQSVTVPWINLLTAYRLCPHDFYACIEE